MAYGIQREIGDRVYVAREHRNAYDALKAEYARIDAEFAPRFAAIDAEFAVRASGMPSRLAEMVRRGQIDEMVSRGLLKFSSDDKRQTVKGLEAWYKAEMDAAHDAKNAAKAAAKQANAEQYL